MQIFSTAKYPHIYTLIFQCSPPGYAAYFAANSNLPSSYWTPGLTACTPPYPNDGTRGTTWPEREFTAISLSSDDVLELAV
jgi:hypothetical protein